MSGCICVRCKFHTGAVDMTSQHFLKGAGALLTDMAAEMRCVAGAEHIQSKQSKQTKSIDRMNLLLSAPIQRNTVKTAEVCSVAGVHECGYWRFWD